MMLVEHDVEAKLIRCLPLVVVAMEKVGRDVRIAFLVEQVDAQRAGMIVPGRIIGLLGELVDFMASSLRTAIVSFASHKGHHLTGERLRLFMIGEMPGAVDEFETRARNHCAIGAAIGFAEHTVLGAPQEQGRDMDAVQAVFQPRIVEVWVPGQSRRRLAGARSSQHLGIRQRLVVPGADLWVGIDEIDILLLGQRKTSTMSRVSRSATLTPTALAATTRDIRAVVFTAISAAIQAPSDTPTTVRSRRSS